MKWTIDKSFDFCYGHRVHNQALNAEYVGTEGTCLKCRHIHGHQGKLKMFLESNTLTDGMVTDFKHLGWLRDFIDDVLDHKFIMDINDPLITHEVPDYIIDNALDLGKCIHYDNDYWVLNLDKLDKDINQAIYEKYEGFIFVDFVPTSENITSWLLTIAQRKMKDLDIKVVSAEYWETPKSHCKVEV